jgi:citrate synthase
MKELNPGLEGVVVAETRLSLIDGERGQLWIGGLPVEQLAEEPFEAACGLLLDGALPTTSRLAWLRAGLGRGRLAAYAALEALRGALSADDPMNALMASVALLKLPQQDATERALALTGAMAVLAAAHGRLRAGDEVPIPDPAADHAADLLRLLGAEGGEAGARALGRYLSTVCDHGMNASTFTARTVASTGVDTASAVVAALAALKGPLHGGAPGPVLDMLDAIGEPVRAERWVRNELAAGRRIMGMGHRVYRARDPRAAALEGALSLLPRSAGRLALARAVEQAADTVLRERHPSRPLCANVEFSTAVLLEALAIPRGAFTSVFACGRVVGWCAHIEEQRRSGRLIRPAARYVGPILAA